MSKQIINENSTIIKTLPIQIQSHHEHQESIHSPLKISTLSSLKFITTSSYLNILLIFIPLGYLSHFYWGEVPTFILNCLAIIPLAKLLGFYCF